MSTNRQTLDQYLQKLLTPEKFSDYCPNGLQIEGCGNISNIAFAVSATQDSIEKCINLRTQALIVHHGLFWKFHGPRTITGALAKRIKPLIISDINLFAYHLPLDAHHEIGNAQSVGELIGLKNTSSFGDYQGSPTGICGSLKKSLSAAELKKVLEKKLSHKVMLSSPNPKAKISSIGIITGGANSDWKLAARQGLDAYLTGEMSEHDWHDASEAGIHMFAGGHHATEKWGIQNLMKKVAKDLKVKCHFIDSENPA
jgi:dinuclear metal center YbgI/SA1388 family protein